MKKSTIEAIIGTIAVMLLIYFLAFLTADDFAEYVQYMHGASTGFILGVLLTICLHRLREKENK